MKHLTKDEELYLNQMELWLEEQQTLDNQLVSAIEYHKKMMELNKKQLSLHRERINIGSEEFTQWKTDKELI